MNKNNGNIISSSRHHVDNQKSSTSSTNSGVPQGTVMGPPCFNLSYDDRQVSQNLATSANFAPCIGGKHGVDSANQAIGHIME